MKRIIFYAFLLSILLVVVVYAFIWFLNCYPGRTLVCQPIDQLGSFYAKNLRGSLFSGFLTLGGFLLSLKTFIIVNMKKEVFDTETYLEIWTKQSKLDKEGVGSLYRPLSELSEALVYAIVACVLTAVSQFTIGLFESVVSSIFCMWAALLSVMLLLICLWTIRGNLQYMFRHLERVAEEKAREKDDPSLR